MKYGLVFYHIEGEATSLENVDLVATCFIVETENEYTACDDFEMPEYFTEEWNLVQIFPIQFIGDLLLWLRNETVRLQIKEIKFELLSQVELNNEEKKMLGIV
jgi:hypothetical protein